MLLEARVMVYRYFLTAGALISQRAASVLLCLVVFEVADVDGGGDDGDDDEICSWISLSAPAPWLTTLDQQHTDRRRSLNRR